MTNCLNWMKKSDKDDMVGDEKQKYTKPSFTPTRADIGIRVQGKLGIKPKPGEEPDNGTSEEPDSGISQVRESTKFVLTIGQLRRLIAEAGVK